MDGWIWLLSLGAEAAWSRTYCKSEDEGWLAKLGGSAVVQYWFYGHHPSTEYPCHMRFVDASVQTGSTLGQPASDVMAYHLTKTLVDLREDLLKALTQCQEADVQAVEQRVVGMFEAETASFEQRQDMQFTLLKHQFEHFESTLQIDNAYRDEVHSCHEVAIENRLQDMEQRASVLHDSSMEQLAELQEKSMAAVAERISTGEQAMDEMKSNVETIASSMADLTSNLKREIMMTIMEMVASRRGTPQLENKPILQLQAPSTLGEEVGEDEDAGQTEELEVLDEVADLDIDAEEEVTEQQGEDEKDRSTHEHNTRSRSPSLRRRRRHTTGTVADIAETWVDDSKDQVKKYQTPPWRRYRGWMR